MARKASKKPTKRKVEKREWAQEGNHKTIKLETYDRIIEWLALPDDDQRATRLDLLTRGLPWGTIVSAELHPSRTDMIAVKAKNAKGEVWNSPRLFDSAAFALMRLLTAFGGTIRMNKRLAADPAKQEGPDHYFPAITWGELKNFAMSRIVWGVTSYDDVDQIKSDDPSTPKRDVDALIGTFYDLRLANLESETGNKPADRTRGDAVMAALVCRFDLQKKLRGLPIADDYLKAILKCFALLDAVKAEVLKRRKD